VVVGGKEGVSAGGDRAAATLQTRCDAGGPPAAPRQRLPAFYPAMRTDGGGVARWDALWRGGRVN
jgi:hypothetical protein